MGYIFVMIRGHCLVQRLKFWTFNHKDIGLGLGINCFIQKCLGRGSPSNYLSGLHLFWDHNWVIASFYWIWTRSFFLYLFIIPSFESFSAIVGPLSLKGYGMINYVAYGLFHKFVLHCLSLFRLSFFIILSLSSIIWLLVFYLNYFWI